MSDDSTTTATTAPHGDPVGGAAPTAPSATGGNEDIANQLRELMEEVRGARTATTQPDGTEEAGGETDPGTPERPTGGLNDIQASDLENPDVARFVRLLDAHYPNLDRERVLGRAIEFGDATYIDEAYLRDTVGEHADILLGYFEDIVEEYSEGVEGLVSDIHERAGGKERWDSITRAFKQDASPNIQSLVKRLIDSNSTADVQQGLDFIFEYVDTKKLVTKPAKRPATGGGAGGGDALSAEDFAAAIRELGGRHANPQQYDRAVVQLRQRRAAGIELGL